MAIDRLNGDVPVMGAEAAAGSIGTDDVVLVSGFGSVGYPKAIPLAIARADRDYELTVVSGGVVGSEIDTELVRAGAVARRYPTQTDPELRDAINAGSVAYHDRHLSRVGDEVRTGHFGDPDVAVVEAIAVGEDWLIPSASIGQTPAFVHAADRLVVEVNDAGPLGLRAFHDVYPRDLPPDRSAIPLADPGGRIGGPRIEFAGDKLAAVVRTDRSDEGYEFREPTPTDRAIADNLIGFLRAEAERTAAFADRLVVQFGVGSLGNALMAAFGSADFAGRELVFFGEVVQDGLLEAIGAGTISTASATSLALSGEGFDRLFDDIDRWAGDIVLRNTDVSNHPGLIDRFGVVGINAALEVDLYGNANVTHIDGSKVVNGIGGGGDFTRNSLLGVIVLGSTADGGDISRIVPMVPHVDHTEHDLSVVVTERGVADLRGLDPRERAASLIENCAHPRYRDDLRRYLDRAEGTGGHVPHDLDTCFTWGRGDPS